MLGCLFVLSDLRAAVEGGGQGPGPVAAAEITEDTAVPDDADEGADEGAVGGSTHMDVPPPLDTQGEVLTYRGGASSGRALALTASLPLEDLLRLAVSPLRPAATATTEVEGLDTGTPTYNIAFWVTPSNPCLTPDLTAQKGSG